MQWASIRWLLVPFAASGGFAVSMALSIPLNILIHHILWTSDKPMPGKNFLLYAMPYDGALAASLVLQFGTYAAPSHKTWTALSLLILGAFLAWQLVGEFIRLVFPIMAQFVFGGQSSAHTLEVSLLLLGFISHAERDRIYNTYARYKFSAADFQTLVLSPQIS